MTFSARSASISSEPAITFDRVFAPYSCAASNGGATKLDRCDDQDVEISLPRLSTVVLIAGSSALACLAFFGALAWLAQALD